MMDLTSTADLTRDGTGETTRDDTRDATVMETRLANGDLRSQVAEFYRREAIAGGYLSQRYAGSSGAGVSRREVAIAAALLPRSGRVLDVACGAGRLGAILPTSLDLFGIDTSPAMLDQARAEGRYSLVVGDAFALPFADDSFDATVALRLLFHFPDPGPLLAEMTRVTRPGGTVVFETASWSPRSGRALGAAQWGPKIFAHRDAVIRGALRSAGLRPIRSVEAFLVSPVLYRWLPPLGAFVLERVERQLPAAWRCRQYWQAVVGQDLPVTIQGAGR